MKLGQTVSYNTKVDEEITYSVGKGYVDCEISPTFFFVRDTLTMKVTDKFEGSDTITFAYDDGWKK